jgi:hypothetical protein
VVGLHVYSHPPFRKIDEEKKNERDNLRNLGGILTNPTALKTLTSNAFLHSSAVLSATFFTGSKLP